MCLTEQARSAIVHFYIKIYQQLNIFLMYKYCITNAIFVNIIDLEIEIILIITYNCINVNILILAILFFRFSKNKLNLFKYLDLNNT